MRKPKFTMKVIDELRAAGGDAWDRIDNVAAYLNGDDPNAIRFVVPAVPVAQPRQRHRVIQAGGRTFASNYTPANDPVNAFKAAVQVAARAAYSGPPIEGPIRMELDFVFPRPASIPKKLGNCRLRHVKKPDRDNLMKSLQDALNGLLYRDDSQICDGVVRKFIASVGEQPHVSVAVMVLE